MERRGTPIAGNLTTDLSSLPAQVVSGAYFDDFNDGSFGPAYFIRNPAQATEASGYAQLNQNVTDNGPSLYLLYERGANRYVRIQWRQLSHRNNTYFVGFLQVADATGMSDRYLLTMAYKDDWPCYGLCNQRWTCSDANAYGSCEGYSGAGVDATQIFDTWMDLEMQLDLVGGTVTRKINGTAYAGFPIRPDWGSRIFVVASPSGWFTGHYIQIDDLSIQAQDTPFP